MILAIKAYEKIRSKIIKTKQQVYILHDSLILAYIASSVSRKHGTKAYRLGSNWRAVEISKFISFKSEIFLLIIKKGVPSFWNSKN